jgi:hypothetical protein
MSRARQAALVVVAAIVARALGLAIVHRLGFVVVSDDDFARVVIAQRFAADPAFDPTGTSWLPLPFWVNGAAMRLLGSSLEIARALAVVAALASGALLAIVASRLGMRASRVVAASCATAWMPWSMQLGVATVPEVPASACAAIGAMTLASDDPTMRAIGGLAMLASTLSRYDAWPMAIAFCAISLVDFARTRESRARITVAFAGALAVAGIVGWSLWQRVHFGDAFRYLRLVRAYRQALGAGPSIAQRVLGYPRGIVEELREVLGAAIVATAAAWALSRRRTTTNSSADLRWSRPLALAAIQLVMLIAGDVRDGAPTHHPERALLGPATIVLFASADTIGAWLDSISNAARRLAWAVALSTCFLGWIGVRLHRTMWWYDAAPRAREVAAGHALRAVVAPGERVLLDTRDFEGGLDYGYEAVRAAFGRPLEVVIDRDQDPRKPHVASAFESADRLASRASTAHTKVLLAWGRARARVAESIGARSIEGVARDPGGDDVDDSAHGRWRLFRLP